MEVGRKKEGMPANHPPPTAIRAMWAHPELYILEEQHLTFNLEGGDRCH